MACERMAKTIVMLAAMVVLVGASTACFGVFGSDKPSTQDPCAGLVGQARSDCEARQAAGG